MATQLTTRALNSEIQHYDNIKTYITELISLECSVVGVDTINLITDTMANLGIIQVSTALEHAIAKVSGLSVVSCDSHDLSDGSDVKSITTRWTDDRSSLRANVSGLKNKTGPIRLQLLNHIDNQFYYFVIPYCEYAGKKSIEIPFLKTGEPGRRSNNIWWRYEVSSFDELCKPIEHVTFEHTKPSTITNNELFIF